jgi:hypothetical protein
MSIEVHYRKGNRRYKKILKIHLGLGNTNIGACGVILFSRYAMVSLHDPWDGLLITDDPNKVTCERCKKTNRMRWWKMVRLERCYPGILDRPALCGEKWLLDHGLDVTQANIDGLTIKREGK